jgi:periplasmic protein TonB
MVARVAERRPLGALGRMAVVAGMHVAFVLVIARSLVMSPEVPLENIEAVVLDEPQPPTEPTPRIADPTLQEVRLYQPLTEPDVRIDVEVPPDIGITSDPPRDDLLRQPRVAPAEMVGVRLDPRNPLTQPAYPARDIRAGNEGACHVEVYVLPNGRVGDARIVKSTGSPTLDQSALDEAKRRWRFQPAMQAGSAVPQWYAVKIVFRLEDLRR